MELIEHFVTGTTARCTSELLHMNRNTVWLYFHCLRKIIAYELELDESYFGGARKGKRGQGAGGKTIVFGVLKRGSE